MSLVGTRPPTVDEWDKYELHHRARLATKPGLTGMWQVSGRSNITDLGDTQVNKDVAIVYSPLNGTGLKPVIRTLKESGYCQLDDVVTNTVGMLVGWGIWKMLSSVGIAGNPLF